MLSTDRLLLREVQERDAETLFRIKSNADVTSRYGQEPHRSIDDTRAWVQRIQGGYQRREAIYWCITLKNEDAAIGACTFWNFDASFHCAELGYELHPSYWHVGIMTEALSTIISYGFSELGFHRIEACPLAENKPSKELLLKLGFKYEGTLRQRHFFRGHYKDQLYFGLLREEWPYRV
jgi:ribosomal-protein-alanine N-acetyltransferase